MINKPLKFWYLASAALTALPLPAAAQDWEPGEGEVMLGAGLQSKPRYPGASSNRITILPLLEVWRDGQAVTVKSPDDGINVALIGRRGGRFAAGPTLGLAPTRAAEDVPGLPEVGFGVETGVFAEVWPIRPLRLRAELSQGIGAHKALTGDLAADLVWRRGKGGPVFTAGPRLRWGSAKYNRVYFGVGKPGTAALAPFEPGSGIYAVGQLPACACHWGGLSGFTATCAMTGLSAGQRTRRS